MRKLFTAALLIALVAVLAANPLWAKAHSFKLIKPASINGTELRPGHYKVEMNGENEAVISRDGKVIVTARAQTRAASATDMPGSVVLTADGNVKEICLKGLVVVFVR